MAVTWNPIDKFRKKHEDIGIDHNVQAGRQRIINADGTFNIVRKHEHPSDRFHLYHWLLNISWVKYWTNIAVYYLGVNAFFAMIYYVIGVEHLNGIEPGIWWKEYLYCFFFSAQSFTTVGYGGINPSGLLSNFVATFEAFCGLMTFAIATGTMYGRFSKPSSKFKYGPKAIVNPFPVRSFQFIVANVRSANLMEVEVTVNFSFVIPENGIPKRKFFLLPLSISRITMFPTSWTVVHPIDEDSPMYGKTSADLIREEAEFLILMKGFDESVSQTIYNRFSYKADEVLFDKKFKMPFYVNEHGQTLLDLSKVGEFQDAVV